MCSADLDEYSNNYANLFRSALRYLDLKSLIPIHDWWEYPITAVMTCRGCTHNCAICGGSRFALKHFYARDHALTAARKKSPTTSCPSPGYTNAPIFVVGDLRQAGEDIRPRPSFRGSGAVRPEEPGCPGAFYPRAGDLISGRLPRLFRISISRFPPNPTTRRSAALRESSTPTRRWRIPSVSPSITAVPSSMFFS